MHKWNGECRINRTVCPSVNIYGRCKLHESAFKKEDRYEPAFSWSDSDAEDDFGGSDSDEEMFDDDEDTDGDADDE